jgi:hypothetical protein
MRKTKKQHYVPQTALRRFSEDGDRISVFDKIRNEVRMANIRDVAQQRYFYDIPQEAIPPELEGTLDRQMIEHTLSGLESDFHRVVSQVIDKVNRRSIVRRFLNGFFSRGRIISRKNKRALCFFVALQYLRTREFRRTIQDGLEQFEAVMRKRIPEEQDEKFFEGFRGVTDANIRMHHLSMMFDREFVNGLTKMLYGHILVIGKTFEEHSLYTSDNPMVRQPHRTHPFLGNAGIGSPGIEIAMPLSSNHILIFMEKTHFAEWANWDRKVVSLKPGHVEYYNSLQVRGCDRQVYCTEDDFDVAREFCRRWPQRCEEERRRVVVE